MLFQLWVLHSRKIPNFSSKVYPWKNNKNNKKLISMKETKIFLWQKIDLFLFSFYLFFSPSFKLDSYKI